MRPTITSSAVLTLKGISMTRCGRNLIDGRGPDRMVAALEIMLHSHVHAKPLRIAA